MEQALASLPNLLTSQHGIAFLLTFLAGLASAASPCVLAAVPLVIAYVGGYAEGSRKKAALFSGLFVLGLSTTFTILGAFASQIGSLLAFTGTWLYLSFAAITIIMGLHILGLIPITLNLSHRIELPWKAKGAIGAFSIGLFTGILSSPCATPVLAVILAYVSTEGDVLYGSSLLFVYAVGHCALIFVAGLSIGLAQAILDSQLFQGISRLIKKASGLVLIGIGIYVFYKTLLT
ncbi:MAG: cytochrome c biogenesis protein CcdA [Dissulfuribacterales bacterium]